MPNSDAAEAAQWTPRYQGGGGGSLADSGTRGRDKQAVRVRNALGAFLEEAEREIGSSYGATMWRKLEDGTRKAYAVALQSADTTIVGMMAIFSASRIPDRRALIGDSYWPSLATYKMRPLCASCGAMNPWILLYCRNLYGCSLSRWRDSGSHATQETFDGPKETSSARS